MAAKAGKVKDIVGANEITSVVRVQSMNMRQQGHGEGTQGRQPPVADCHVKFEQVVMML